MENNQRWQPADRSLLESEKIARPSLTYWQDCWQRLRKNKSAILSLVVIVIIVLAAIFVPMFWRFSYDQQNLEFANIPPQLQLYDLGEENYVYLTNDFKSIDTDSAGNLIAPSKMVKDDKTNRMYIYEINDKPLVVDYGVYFKAKSEFIQQEAANAATGLIPVADADNPPESGAVTVEEAKRILDKKIERFAVTYGGEVIRPFKTVSNKTYVWGSDSLGRDVFIRVMYGARMSLLVGVIAAIVNFVIGVLYGGIAGFCGGRVDNIMMRIVDTISSIPMMLYVILLMVVLGPGLQSIIIAMGLTHWVGMARIVRSQVLSMREQEFVLAATLLGVPSRKILTRHLIPNAMGPIMVSITMQIPSAMFTEAFLSFIGLGVSKPKASWGALANAALPGLYTNPYQLFYPALIMSITILALNLFSDGLRDSLDPRLRK
jgi:oligopeptide transport system permease protein